MKISSAGFCFSSVQCLEKLAPVLKDLGNFSFTVPVRKLALGSIGFTLHKISDSKFSAIGVV